MRYTRGNNKKDKKMIGRFRRRPCGRRYFCLLNLSTIVCLLTIFLIFYLFTEEEEYEPNKLGNVNHCSKLLRKKNNIESFLSNIPIHFRTICEMESIIM